MSEKKRSKKRERIPVIDVKYVDMSTMMKKKKFHSNSYPQTGSAHCVGQRNLTLNLKCKRQM